MVWISLTILLIFKLFLAGKDATSYKLRGRDTWVAGRVSTNRIKRWHRDGVALDAILTGVLMWATGLYIVVPIQSLLARLAIYDLAFNHWADLNIHYLGSTSWVDKQFIKILGTNGAVIKSAVFAVILLILNIIWSI